MNCVKSVIKEVKEAIIERKYKYYINAEYAFGDIDIRIKKDRRVAKIKLHDVFSENMDSSAIQDVYKDINKTQYKYLHLIAYDKYGIYVYLSDDFIKPYIVNKRRGYQEITIPVYKYRGKIKKMLHYILLARGKYKAYMMNDLEADLSANSLIISSKYTTIKMNMYKVAKSLPDTNDSMEYILKQIGLRGWYMISPLSGIPADYNMDDAIIITGKQLSENIIPPTEFFDVSMNVA